MLGLLLLVFFLVAFSDFTRRPGVQGQVQDAGSRPSLSRTPTGSLRSRLLRPWTSGGIRDTSMTKMYLAQLAFPPGLLSRPVLRGTYRPLVTRLKNTSSMYGDKPECGGQCPEPLFSWPKLLVCSTLCQNVHGGTQWESDDGWQRCKDDGNQGACIILDKGKRGSWQAR